ncbi:MAG: hypothetical protein CMH32_01600 [Micavibrio sp.]|nr:hypothetical protein [Micavibrio sp.]HCK32152.1 hypothetical protein [Rhodospirillaceae bacterium]
MKKVDINNIIKQLTGPNSTQDMMTFFEGLPSKAGKTLLVAGGVAWMVAGVAILYGSIQSDKIAQMRIDLAQTEALTPPVPTVKNINVDQGQIEYFVTRAAEEYKKTGVDIKNENGKIVISGNTGRQYGAFREAIGHIQNGGDGWRVSVEQLCVGRECAGKSKAAKSFLYGQFSVSRVDIDMPS